MALIGEVVGTTGTRTFSFVAYKEVQRLDFVAVKDEENRWILCQVMSVTSEPDGESVKNKAKVRVIGYRTERGLVQPKKPIRPRSLVYLADKKVIQETLGLKREGLYIGVLDANRECEVYLDPKELVSKHVSVLAQTGSGKSYTVGVILEELLEQNLPVVVLDPHGEHVSLRFKNDNPAELEKMPEFKIKPKAYPVVEYSPDPRVNPGAEPLTFSDKNLSIVEIENAAPGELTGSQLGLLYTAIRNLKKRGSYTLDDIIAEVENEESAAKWHLMNKLEYIRDMGIFTRNPTPIESLVQPGVATIINLRGIPPEIQGLVAFKITHDLFEMRKMGRVPPLFLVIEEAHNFCPEKTKTTASDIIRTVASEGRKFGMGLCVISQRPARVDKNVISQCNTQIILKITNPNDLKAVSTAEGIDQTVQQEIKNLSPGIALILGQQIPLFVAIRVRRSKHGGVTVDITQRTGNGKRIPVLRSVSRANIESRLGELKTLYYPCYIVETDRDSYLFEGMQGNLVYIEGDRVKQKKIGLGAEHLAILDAIGDTPEPKRVVVENLPLSPEVVEQKILELQEMGMIEERHIQGEAYLSKTKARVLHPFNHEVSTGIIDGEVLRPKVSERQILEIVKPLLGDIKNISLVYYPYFLGPDFMIDGITGLKKKIK